MTARFFLYVDAPQHIRIAETVVQGIYPWQDSRLLATVPVPPAFGKHARGVVGVVAVASPPPRGPRAWSMLCQGLSRLRTTRRCLNTLAPAGGQVTLVVFNDTGIVQRALIALGRRRDWHTVLVQDGLTETRYREVTRTFQVKRTVTAWLLAPLGLGHLGTSRYGEAGARTILSDGPAASAFFRARAPSAQVREVGFLRPGPSVGHQVARQHVLFWAGDFLGGLRDTRLHEAQLVCIAQLSEALAGTPGLRLQVRLHPRDVEHLAAYRSHLAALANVDLVDPTANPDPFAAGLPLASISLQSAGVFDALAAGVPSWFLRHETGLLGPAWAPETLQAENVLVIASRLQQAAGSDTARTALWLAQVEAIRPRLRIPFDPLALRQALDSDRGAAR